MLVVASNPFTKTICGSMWLMNEKTFSFEDSSLSYHGSTKGSYGSQRHGKTGSNRGFGKSKKSSWKSSDSEHTQQGVIRYLEEPIAGIVKVDETENEFRFRVLEPEGFSEFKVSDFDGKLPEGIYVVRAMRSDGEWQTQSIRFKKDNYSFEEAQDWLKKHESLFSGNSENSP